MTDQPLVARSVAATGAGRLLKKGAPASEIAPVLADLLSSSAAREAAARMGSAIRATPGAKLGADAIESTLNGDRRPSIA